MGACCSQKLDSAQFMSDLSNVDPRIKPIYNPTPQEEQELINVISSSFSGDQNHEPELTWHWWFGEENSDFKSEKRKELFDYYSKFCLKLTLQFGVVYAIQDPDTKKFGGVALMAPPSAMDKGNFMTNMRLVRTGIQVGAQPPNRDQKRFSKDIEGRGNALTEAMKPPHQKYGLNPHWYLYVLAVGPQSQGKGLGGGLLKLFNSLADKDKTMSYLECTGEQKLGFYKKHGYKIIETIEMQYKEQKCPHKTYVVTIDRN